MTELAIEWAEKCQELPVEDPALDRTLKTNLATWQETCGSLDEANSVLDKAYRVVPFSYWVVPLYLQFLSRHDYIDQIYRILEDLNYRLDPANLDGCSARDLSACEIDDFLWDLSDSMLTNEAIRKVGWHSKNFELAKEIYSRAISAARMRGLRVESAAIGHQLGILYYHSFLLGSNDVSIAISHWEQVLKEINKTGGTRIPEWLRENVEESLARMYLAKGQRTTGEGGTDEPFASKYLAKLQALTDSVPPLGERILPVPLNIQRTSLLLGYCNRIRGEMDLAKQRFRANFREGIEMLRDTIIDNDQAAFSRLRSVLLAAGDYDNAAAAMHCSILPTDTPSVAPPTSKPNFTLSTLHFSESDRTWNITSPPSPEAQLACQQQLAMPFSCDGPDHTDFLTETFWTCTSCFHIDLCERCYASVKRREIAVKTCNPSHEFLHMRPAQREMRVGMIAVKGEMVGLDEWLEGIIEKWVEGEGVLRGVESA